MKTLVWEAPRVMQIREQPVPAPPPGEVLLKVAYAGICGSELSGYLGHNALRVPPLVMGHEFAGTIAALGDAVPARFPQLAVGTRATANPMWYCGDCRFCTAGQTHLCSRRSLIGAHRPGAYAEYVSLPAELVVALPAAMPERLGALAEPVAVAVRLGALAGATVHQWSDWTPTNASNKPSIRVHPRLSASQFQQSEQVLAGVDVLVLGAGPIGLLALQVLRLQGARRVFMADRDPARLAVAAALGATPLDPQAGEVAQAVRAATGGEGVPVSIDAVGAVGTRAACVSATRSGGTLLLSGLHEEASVMPAAEIIRREITVRGCFCYTQANFAAAVDLLARGAIGLDPWIVEAPLEDGGAWFERLIAAPGAVAKVLLRPE